MKVRVEIQLEGIREDQRYDEYLDHYKDMGMLYDKDGECAYKIIKTKFIPHEGQRILFDGLYHIVKWSCLELSNPKIQGTIVITVE